MSVDTTLCADVNRRMAYINENFVEDRMKGSHLLGSGFGTNACITSSVNEFMSAVFGGYDAFTSMYGSHVKSVNTLSNIVLYRNTSDTIGEERNAYNVVTFKTTKAGVEVTAGNENLGANVLQGELNLSKCLTGGLLLDELNRVRKLYSLLDPLVYNRYVSFITKNTTPTTSNNFKLHTYSLSSGNSAFVIDNSDKFDEVKQLIYDLMHAQNFARTKDFIGSSVEKLQGSTNKDEKVAKEDQGINTSDDVIIIKSDSNGDKITTKEITLKGVKDIPQEKRNLIISFKAKMNQGTTSQGVTLISNGRLEVNLKAAGADNMSFGMSVTSDWQTFTRTVTLPNISGDPLMSFTSIRGPRNQKLREVLITELVVKPVDNADDTSVAQVPAPIFVETDVFVIRRCLRLYELMINHMIASTLYVQNKGGNFTRQLVVLTYKLLLSAWFDATKDTNDKEDDSMADLGKMLNERIKIMKSDSIRIDELDSMTSDLKLTLKAESDKLANRREKEKKAVIVMSAALGIMMVVALVSMGAYFAPMDKPRKLSIIGIAFAVAILSAIVLNLIYNKQVEGFYSTNITPRAYRLTADETNNVNAAKEWSNVALTIAIDYLDQTINTAYMLGSFRTYGNINQMMNREKTVYEARAMQMNNSSLKLGDANNFVTLAQNKHKARISFFTYLAIVIVLTIIALLMLDSLPGAQKVVLPVSGALIVVLAIAYFMETSGRVHTSGDKYYWAPPDVRKLA